MRAAGIALCVGYSILLLGGCGDDALDYPAGDGGWQLFLKIGDIPRTFVEYPLLIDLKGELVNLDSGTFAADGTVIVFGTSGGSFGNGLAEIEKTTSGGVATASLQVQKPGTYEVSVEYPELMVGTTVTFTVGLES